MHTRQGRAGRWTEKGKATAPGAWVGALGAAAERLHGAFMGRLVERRRMRGGEGEKEKERRGGEEGFTLGRSQGGRGQYVDQVVYRTGGNPLRTGEEERESRTYTSEPYQFFGRSRRLAEGDTLGDPISSLHSGLYLDPQPILSCHHQLSSQLGPRI